MRGRDGLLIAVMLTGIASAQHCAKINIDRSSGFCTVPDHALTPGEMDPAKVCNSNVERRDVTTAEKNAILAAYDWPADTDKSNGEFDHWLPHWMGVSDGQKNIWFEPHAGKYGSFVKDKVERWTATDHAAQRATTPDKLQRLLRGDLDTIVAKALKKNPQERYASIVAFANDLRRYLRHQPISARPDTFSYRAAKFVRRNRVVVGLASLAVLAMFAGVVGVLIQARTARRQRDFALEQLKRSEEHDELLNFLLYNAPKGKIFSVADLLTRAEKVVEKQQSSNAARRADLWMWLAEDCSSQDQPGKARVLAEKAYALSSGLPDPSMHARAACVLAATLSGVAN